MFRVGDRVKAIFPRDRNHNVVGKLGTIIEVRKIGEYAYFVEFDEPVHETPTNRWAKEGHGWALCQEDVVLLEEDDFLEADGIELLI